jgi:dTDP-4-dehydrorhamnose reductase
MKVLVTGSTGQLGQALQFIAKETDGIDFVFADSQEGNICDTSKLSVLFDRNSPDFCINAAAYTAVDKAESEQDVARKINVEGVANLAHACKHHGTTLIHISTDFVFDGSKKMPYTEQDKTNPQSVYGATKRDGELAISQILEQHYIIRTSWVYSQFSNNFMKTMLRLAGERDSLNVVSDQIGTPTHAVDLAKAIMTIVASGKKIYGIYNFSNEGQASWYDFAKKIFEVNNIKIDLKPIPTSAYPTPAARPAYSVLDKTKIKEVFSIEIEHWEKRVTAYNEHT